MDRESRGKRACGSRICIRDDFYTGSQDVKQDLKRAYTAFEAAAKKGHAASQYNVGIMLMNGQGTKQDLPAAAGWFRKAADQGHALAQFNMGIFYASGKGVEKILRPHSSGS
ncbi:MAG: sel1 repeat family protein [Thiobacillus sp.]|nr:MAG: sel1 repeat family protein [Thiobacillus sp.]